MRRGRPLPAQIRVLREGQYGQFFIGNGLSLVGTWMQRIGCSWLVWHWTESAFWVGILAACDLMPVMIIGPIAGVAADRWDRLRQNQYAQSLSAMVAVALAILYAIGHLNLFWLIFLVTTQGTLMAAVQAARLAMVNQLVPRADLGTAVALNSVAVNLARLLGPAAAGLMIVQVDIVWVFVVNAVVTLLFVVVLGRLRLAPRDTPPMTGSFFGQLVVGFRHLFHTPALRLVLGALFLGGVLLRALLELAPALAAQSFANSATGLAVLTSSAGVGAVVGAILSQAALARLIRTVLLWWVFGAAASFVLIHTTNGWIAVPAAMAMGAAMTHALVGTQTYVQLTTPDELRGRMLSVFGLIARGSPALGALIIGFAADRVGLPDAVTVGAAVLALSMLLLLPLVRRLGGDAAE